MYIKATLDKRILYRISRRFNYVRYWNNRSYSFMARWNRCRNGSTCFSRYFFLWFLCRLRFIIINCLVFHYLDTSLKARLSGRGMWVFSNLVLFKLKIFFQIANEICNLKRNLKRTNLKIKT